MRFACLAGLIVAAAASAQQPAVSRARFISDMDSLFRRMDLDSSGQINRKEIEQFQRAQAESEARQRNRAVFAQLDTDKNGQLSPEEYDRFNPPPNTANATPMLTVMDRDRNQSISLVEHRQAKLINFDRLDTNKDGVVTPEELKAGGAVR